MIDSHKNVVLRFMLSSSGSGYELYQLCTDVNCPVFSRDFSAAVARFHTRPSARLKTSACLQHILSECAPTPRLASYRECGYLMGEFWSLRGPEGQSLFDAEVACERRLCYRTEPPPQREYMTPLLRTFPVDTYPPSTLLGWINSQFPCCWCRASRLLFIATVPLNCAALYPHLLGAMASPPVLHSSAGCNVS